MFESLKGDVEGVRNIAHIDGYIANERTVRATVDVEDYYKMAETGILKSGSRSASDA